MAVFSVPAKIYFKRGSLPVAMREFSEVYGFRRAFVISEQQVFSLVDDRIRAGGTLTAGSLRAPGTASVREADELLKTICGFDPDVIVGAGGRGTLDLAKAVCRDAGGEVKLVLIEAPACVGTGCIPYAVLTDDDGEKMVISGPGLMPEMTVTDPDLMCGAGSEEIRAGGRAAMERAAGAYVSDGASEFVKGLAAEAFCTAAGALDSAAGGDIRAVETLCYAASLAGIAYGNSGEPVDPSDERRVREGFEELSRMSGR
jgi:acetaldehyde dehydrogenase/alcohol dehydrogenase